MIPSGRLRPMNISFVWQCKRSVCLSCVDNRKYVVIMKLTDNEIIELKQSLLTQILSFLIRNGSNDDDATVNKSLRFHAAKIYCKSFKWVSSHEWEFRVLPMCWPSSAITRITSHKAKHASARKYRIILQLNVFLWAINISRPFHFIH